MVGQGGFAGQEGPNELYIYVPSPGNDVSTFNWWIHSEISNNQTDFCKAQCPNSTSVQFQSCDSVRANTTRHESGSGVTANNTNVGHFANYQNAVNGTNPATIGYSANIGVAIERVVDVPHQTQQGLKATFDATLKPETDALNQATKVEHGDLTHDPDGNFLGRINAADPTTKVYPTCPP